MINRRQKIDVAQQLITQMQNATALTIPQDPIISKALPSVRDVLRLALTFGASSASCESSFSTLARVLTDYRRSMLHGRLARLVLLAFEQDLTSQVCKDKDGLLRIYTRHKNCKKITEAVASVVSVDQNLPIKQTHFSQPVVGCERR